MTEKPASDKTQMATYADLVARIAELEAVLDCRAGRLLLKGATFVVVRDDEPYYCQVYRLIRDHERAIGRWADCDEVYFVRQCGGDTDTRAALEHKEVGEMTREEFIEQLYDYRQACVDIYDENPILAAACRKEALEREEILHAAFDIQSARIAELEAALHALVDARDGEEPGICRGDANVVGGNNIYEECNCVYGCETTVDTTGDLLREIHAPDCPISRARAALEHKEV